MGMMRWKMFILSLLVSGEVIGVNGSAIYVFGFYFFACVCAV